MPNDIDPKSAICMRIFGGLGNQMFQYAAGYALARRLDAPLLLDPVRTRPDHADFALDLFSLDTPIWTPAERASRLSLSSIFRRRSSDKKRARLWPGPRFVQDNFCHSDEFLKLRPGAYASGYFQSEQFFADCAEEIRSLFSPQDVIRSLPADLDARARQPGSVSVHIRRGDYASDSKTTQVHGLLSHSYYNAAHELMSRLVPDANWLVFSDDAEAADVLTQGWARRTIVAGNSREVDLALMARCSHHVIGNSSFSWWGAWLGANPRKSVIAPRQWYARQHMRTVYTDELYPHGWILI